MSYRSRERQIERILLREEARRKRLAKDISTKPELKMMFFRDILANSLPDDKTVFERIEKRKMALLKHGYFDSEGNVTEKGIDALVRRVIKVIRVNKINIVNSKI